MKWFKRIGLVLLLAFFGAGIFIGRFVYKAKVGFEHFETTPHDITIPSDRPAILIISKTTGFRHSEAIEASQPMFSNLEESNNWFIYQTEDAGIFNNIQLTQFDVVIWNNATGTVLNSEQQELFKSFLEAGGGYVGIHAAGDGSHYRWPWYQNNIICATFSHHPLKNQFQAADIKLNHVPDSTWNISTQWNHTDEWYIFSNQPSEKGATVLYTIDGNSIDNNGNILWIKAFNFGMGEHHPVAWFKDIGQGRSFYTSIGHTAETYQNPNYIEMIQKAIRWAGRLDQ